MTIQSIHVEQTYALRHELLVPHLTLADCHLPGDADEQTRHLGAFEGERLIGIMSVYAVAHPSFNAAIAPHSWQLRAIAVMPAQRQCGIGRALTDAALQVCREQHGQRIWCNARASVLDFYTRLGWRKQGARFIIPNIGPHYLMFSDL